jgi:anti-anti-sigma regulatory factor
VLRITLNRNAQPALLKLDGKISGPWVHELERSWSEIRRSGSERALVVDLTDVTFIDAEGRKLLGSITRDGASLQSKSLMTRFIIEQIQQGSNGKHKTMNGG